MHCVYQCWILKYGIFQHILNRFIEFSITIHKFNGETFNNYCIKISLEITYVSNQNTTFAEASSTLLNQNTSSVSILLCLGIVSKSKTHKRRSFIQFLKHDPSLNQNMSYIQGWKSNSRHLNYELFLKQILAESNKICLVSQE